MQQRSQLNALPDFAPGAGNASANGASATGTEPSSSGATGGEPASNAAPGQRGGRRFPAIGGLAFRDPRDADRWSKVRVLKGLDFVYSRFLDLGVEEAMSLEMVAQAVQIGVRQAPSLYALLDRAARTLDIRLPDLYLGHVEDGSRTVGHERPFILLDSGLLDLLDDDELLFMLGRELGHILQGYVTYKMLSRSIADIGNTIGNFTLNVGAMVTTGLEVPLREWDHCSEFSGDRAGLLVVQRAETAISALFKLAAGGHRFFAEMDATLFLEQGRRALYQDRPMGTRLSTAMRSLQAGAPLLAARAAALVEWAASAEYAAVLQGRYLPRN